MLQTAELFISDSENHHYSSHVTPLWRESEIKFEVSGKPVVSKRTKIDMAPVVKKNSTLFAHFYLYKSKHSPDMMSPYYREDGVLSLTEGYHFSRFITLFLNF